LKKDNIITKNKTFFKQNLNNKIRQEALAFSDHKRRYNNTESSVSSGGGASSPKSILQQENSLRVHSILDLSS
tara:strand:- start:775 stop:993 length:219 start_codon:yes stop_codon:yes gene_type:complete